MSTTSSAGPSTTATTVDGGPYELTSHQRAFFERFGFIRIRGLLAPDIDRIIDEFERVFATEQPWVSNEDLHFNDRRLIVPNVTEHSPFLQGLVADPRVVGVVSSLIGADYEDGVSDGSIFSCDTSWHADTFGAPMERYNVKLSLYLDPLTGDNGAIRMIPGTNDWTSEFATSLRRDLLDPATIEKTFGIPADEIPGWTLESEPGDVIAWNFRTIHASFNGGERRRLLSLNFRELAR